MNGAGWVWKNQDGQSEMIWARKETVCQAIHKLLFSNIPLQELNNTGSRDIHGIL
jgi:hypothetical protein